MAFTPEQLGFVVRVVRKGDGNSVGTGILVAPNAVLTCAHVVLREAEWEYHKDKPSLVDAEIGEATLTVEVQGRPIELTLEGDDPPSLHPEGEDLVLLSLKHSVDANRATFITQFDEQTARELEKHRLDVYGYRLGAKAPNPVEAKGSTISTEFMDADKRGLRAFGLLDRVVEGYSGGPVIVSDSDEPHCIGMATLGGEGRMTTIALGSDLILDFLGACGISPRSSRGVNVLSRTRSAISLPHTDGNIGNQTPLPARWLTGNDEIIDQILASLNRAQTLENPIPTTVTAVHGMGGIGKTSSVQAALWSTEFVKTSAFSDGVLWLTLGTEPDILDLLYSSLSALGDNNPPRDLELAASRFRGLVSRRRLVVVLDDAWRSRDVVPFLTGGDARFVITTRDLELSRIHDANPITVDVLSNDKCIALIEKITQEDIRDSDLPAINCLLQDVGGLPIAVESLALSVANGTTWQSLHVAVREAGRANQGLEGDGPLQNVFACFDASFDCLTELEQQRYSLLSVVAEDTAFGLPVAAVLWNTTDDSAKTTLQVLVNRGMLVLNSQPSIEATFRMHDLVRDHARRKLHVHQSIDAAHGNFLNAYIANSPDAIAVTSVPDDGYIHEHLVHHIVEARRSLLSELLREDSGSNLWFVERDSKGKTDRYLSDLQLAYHHFREELERDWKGSNLKQFCLCAVLLATVNSRVASLPSPLLKELCHRRVFSPAKALTYALRNPDKSDRNKAVACVAPYLGAQQLKQLTTYIEGIEDFEDLADALSLLHPWIPESLLLRLLESVKSNVDEWTWRKTLAATISRLPDPSAILRGSHVTDEIRQAMLPFLQGGDRQDVLMELCSHPSRSAWRDIVALLNSEEIIDAITAIEFNMEAKERISSRYDRGYSVLLLELAFALPDARSDIREEIMERHLDAGLVKSYDFDNLRLERIPTMELQRLFEDWGTLMSHDRKLAFEIEILDRTGAAKRDEINDIWRRLKLSLKHSGGHNSLASLARHLSAAQVAEAEDLLRKLTTEDHFYGATDDVLAALFQSMSNEQLDYCIEQWTNIDDREACELAQQLLGLPSTVDSDLDPLDPILSHWYAVEDMVSTEVDEALDHDDCRNALATCVPGLMTCPQSKCRQLLVEIIERLSRRSRSDLLLSLIELRPVGGRVVTDGGNPLDFTTELAAIANQF